MKIERQRYFDENEQQILEEILLHRRDVRGNNFKKEVISKEHIDRILQAALYAPSVGFSQSWEFVLIFDQKIKQAVKVSFQEENENAVHQFSDVKKQEYIKLKLEEITEAPLNIAVFYKPKNESALGQTSMSNVGKYSVVCVIQNIWLMARSLNIGMGWISILNPEKVKKVLNAPIENQLIGYLCFGYTDMFYHKPESKIKKGMLKSF